MKFFIISCGWFDGPYYAFRCVARNTQSVLDQTFGRWDQFVVLDGDTTIDRESLIREYCKDERQYGIMPYDGRRGMASNLWHTVSMIDSDPHDVVVFLDLDDRFAVDTALSTLAIEYDDPECWVTHGSFKKLSGAPTRLNHPLLHKPLRCQRWCMSHCKTCRLGLFKKLKPDDLKAASRNWLSTCSDLALMFALADMAGHERVRFVPEVIYEYNDQNSLNDHKVCRDEQKRMDAYLRRKAPKRRLKAYV